MPDYYNITKKGRERIKWFPASELKAGQLAEIRNDAPGLRDIVLRTGSMIVSLTDPETEWPCPGNCRFGVRLLQQPEEVMLLPNPAIESGE